MPVGKIVVANAPALIQLRNQRRWTQGDLAEKSECSLRTIGRAEGGKAIAITILQRVADALEVPVSSIVVAVEQADSPAAPAGPAISSIFVSHSSHDRAVVMQTIIACLKRLGIKVWYGEDSIRASAKWVPSLVQGLEESEWFMLVMSPRSAESEWVKAEVHWAAEHRWRSNRIIPVLLEDCDRNRFHLFIPRLQFVDFRGDLEQARRHLAAMFNLDWPPGEPERDETSSLRHEEPGAALNSGAGDAQVISDGVRLPLFHCGGVVPPDFFIGREQELELAEKIIRARQSFLIVGVRRSGKTSFCNKLQGRLLGASNNDILVSRLNLEACRDLTIDTFLGHTILNMVGEIARLVFHLRPADLNRPDVAKMRSDLESDAIFHSFVNINRIVTERTHYRLDASPSPFQPHEFVEFVADLLEIIHAKRWRDYVIFYDEANHLPAKVPVELLTGYIEILDEAALTAVYAASPEMDSFMPLHNLFGHQIRIGPFDSQQDLLKLLARYYHGDMSQTNDLPISVDALQLVWDCGQGMPYQSQFLLNYSFRQARAQHAPIVMDAHVKEANALLIRERPEYFGLTSPRG